MVDPPLPGMGRDILPGGPPPELTAQRAAIVVFACGDPAHAEHASVAITACTSLPPELLERVDIKLVGPIRPEYLRDLAPDTHVIVADTIIGNPGELTVVPLIEMSGLEERLEVSSTTDPPLDEVVAMAQLLRDEPLRGNLVALNVESVDLNEPPDPVAVGAMRAAVAQQVAEIDAG